MLLTGLALACVQPPLAPIEESCVPGPLVEGEVRSLRITCGDEIPLDGEVEKGDWLLENSVVRFGIRDATQSLTRLDGTGGTIVDAALPEGTDFIIEAIPTVDGLWFADADVSAWTEDGAAGVSVSGQLSDGRNHTVSYVLRADTSALEIRGADVLELVPMSQSGAVGDTLESYADGEQVVMSGDVPMSDDGGWVQWPGLERWWVGERDAVYRGLWPAGVELRGTSDGAWAIIHIDGDTVARYPVTDGAFSGWAPREADGLVAVRTGYAPSPTVSPSTGVDLAVGMSGFLELQVADESGAPIPATLTWEDVAWPWLPGDTAIPVGPGIGSGTVDGGPRYATITIPEMDLEGSHALEVTLQTVVTPTLLARTDVLASPDRTERRGSESVLAEVAASGVGFALIVADDEVAQVSSTERTSSWIRFLSGSRAASDNGQPIAWPWSPTNGRPAHGAAPWAGLDPQSLLAVMALNGGRWSAVDTTWVAAAGNPAGWDVRPTAIQLSGTEDWPIYQALLDAWEPVTPLGPLTWIDGLELSTPSSSDAMGGILTGQTTATTGPRIRFTADGRAPGEILDPVPFPFREVSLVVEAAERFSLTHAAIIGPGGEELARWRLHSDGPVRLKRLGWIDDVDYLIAATWNEDDPVTGDWAITSPIWSGRP